MSETVEITRQGFLIVDKCVLMYEVLDTTVPWKPIAEEVKMLDRDNGHYTIEAAEIIGKIKTLTSNAADNYFMAKQSIYEMCNLAPRLIATYKVLFDKRDPSNFPAQKQLLLKVLDDGLGKMNTAHIKLEECSTNFNLAAKELAILQTQLTIDFANKSEFIDSVNRKIRNRGYGAAAAGIVLGPFGMILTESVAATIVDGQILPDMQITFEKIKNFYRDLKLQIEKANTDIKSARNKLDSDIHFIQSFPTCHTEAASALFEMNRLYDEIKSSLNDIVKHCEEFKQKNN